MTINYMAHSMLFCQSNSRLFFIQKPSCMLATCAFVALSSQA